MEIVGPKHHGSVGLGLFVELTRRPLLDHIAQPRELIEALI